MQQEAAQANYAQAGRVLARLYETLKTNEKVWGTTQLGRPPRVILKDDRRINAGANWGENSISVNRGAFDLIGKVGPQGEDVLAALLAHELSHISY